MKLTIWLLVLVLLLGSVTAECEPKLTFLGKMQDECGTPNNGICEDSEYPIDNDDCAVTIDAINCSEERCIFEEIWFAKLLIILTLFMLLFYKKDYKIFILIILFALVFNFSNFEVFGETKIIPASDEEVIIPPEMTENNTIYKYGHKVMPSNPTTGFIIIIIAIFLLLRYLLGNYKKWRGYY